MSFTPGGLTNTQLRAAQVPVTPIPTTGVYFRRFGVNTAIGVTFATVDSFGAAAPYMPSTALKFEAVSSSANDTAAGSGARTIEITGLGTAWQIQVETIILNGVTPVQTVNDYLRVTKAEVISVGSYGAVNAGNILVRGTGGGTSAVQIDTGLGVSLGSHFCIPAGYTGKIAGLNYSTDAGKYATLRLNQRLRANNVAAPFAPIEIVQVFDGLAGGQQFDYSTPLEFAAYTDVWATAKVAAATAAISTEFWGWIVPT